jgi:hypothetical protein
MERALEIARDAHDAKVMRDLRAHLDDITKRPGAGSLNRKAALILLRAISDGLKPATDKPIGKMEDGQFLVRSHPAIELLDELIDALSDLDRGVLHDAFKTIRNASLSTSQRKRDDALLLTVLILQRIHGFKYRIAAERLLAQNARRQGYKREGEPISVGLLRKLQYNSKTRKPIKL